MLGYLLPLFAFTWAVTVLYQRIFSPLAKVPGTWHSRLTSFWLMYQEFTSNRRVYIHDLHKKYGPVVRLSPNEVSFTSLEALKEIYTSGGSGYEKTEFYSLFMQFNTRYEEFCWYHWENSAYR